MKIFKYFTQTKRPCETRNKYDSLKIIKNSFFGVKINFFINKIYLVDP